MNLKQIIAALRKIDPTEVLYGVSINFNSYRGYYDQLSVEPGDEPLLTWQFADALENCIGKTFTGYKGGDYKMDDDCNLYVVDYGCTGGMVVGVEIRSDGVHFHTEVEQY